MQPSRTATECEVDLVRKTTRLCDRAQTLDTEKPAGVTHARLTLRLTRASPCEGLPAEVVMADTAYDADPLRQAIAAKGAIAVIPNNPSRALKYPLVGHCGISTLQRHLVRCCFSKLGQFLSCCNPSSKRPHAITALS